MMNYAEIAKPKEESVVPKKVQRASLNFIFAPPGKLRQPVSPDFGDRVRDLYSGCGIVNYYSLSFPSF